MGNLFKTVCLIVILIQVSVSAFANEDTALNNVEVAKPTQEAKAPKKAQITSKDTCPPPVVFCPMMHDPTECHISKTDDADWSLVVRGGNDCLARLNLRKNLCKQGIALASVTSSCKSLKL